MAGPVEDQIRAAIKPGKKLTTPSRRAPFKMAAFSESGIVLLEGEREARTTISWACLEAIPRFLVGRGWVPVSGSYDPRTSTGTIETHLEAFSSGANPGAVVALLEAAGVVELENARPVRVRLGARALELATAATGTGQFTAGTRRMQEGKYRPHPTH